MYEITLNDCKVVINVFRSEEPCKMLRIVYVWDYCQWLQGCDKDFKAQEPYKMLRVVGEW